MHRFDDLPTGTQLQTKVDAERKLPSLNGETETNNKKGCENSQPEFFTKNNTSNNHIVACKTHRHGTSSACLCR